MQRAAGRTKARFRNSAQRTPRPGSAARASRLRIWSSELTPGSRRTKRRERFRSSRRRERRESTRTSARRRRKSHSALYDTPSRRQSAAASGKKLVGCKLGTRRQTERALSRRTATVAEQVGLIGN